MRGEDGDAGTHAKGGASLSAAAAPARILVVEDDFIVGLELEAGLTEAGFEVVGIAMTAEEALSLAVAERPALVVMDIRLGSRRDGIDAAIDILQAVGARCIFASATQDHEIRARAAAAQPLGWIAKPYQVEDLAARIHRVLSAGGQ